MDDKNTLNQLQDETIVRTQSAFSDANARVTQIIAEALGTANRPTPRVTQIGVQVLRRPLLVYTMTGGVVVSGRADCTIALSRTMSGGITIGSTVTEANRGFSRTMNGGVKISGYCDTATTNGSTETVLNGADWEPESTYIPTQVGIGGAASGIRITRVVSPTTGGVSISGTADAKFGLVYTMTGGVTTGGSSSTTANYAYNMHGGISLSGRSPMTLSAKVVMSGGIMLGTTSVTPGASYRYTMTGGINSGGAAAFSPELKFTSRGGGVTMSGRASFQFNLYYTMRGGVQVGGIVQNPSVAFQWTMSGGATIGGTPKVIWGNSYTMLGGVSMSGTGLDHMEATFHYIPEFPHNRVFLYGRGNYSRNSYSHTMTGGVTMRGGYLSDFCTNTCDLSDPFFRDAEALIGCPVLLPNGKIDYICARPIEFLPIDTIKSSRAGAIVPASTVCRQALYATKTKGRNCSSIIRR